MWSPDQRGWKRLATFGTAFATQIARRRRSTSTASCTFWRCSPRSRRARRDVEGINFLRLGGTAIVIATPGSSPGRRNQEEHRAPCGSWIATSACGAPRDDKYGFDQITSSV